MLFRRHSAVNADYGRSGGMAAALHNRSSYTAAASKSPTSSSSTTSIGFVRVRATST